MVLIRSLKKKKKEEGYIHLKIVHKKLLFSKVNIG